MFTFQEDLLHYVWKLQYFNFTNLHTTDGQKLIIVKQGIHNYDSGPDFSAAKIQLENLVWVGNVEIHIKSSDWVKHAHYNDPAFDNIILHVVYEEDEKLLRKNGSIIPCLELKGLIHEEIFSRYLRLKTNEKWVPCENMISNIEELNKKMWLETILVSRLEQKNTAILEILNYTNFNWEFSFLIYLGKYFGANINSAAFEQLCKSISLDKFYKNINDPFVIEAILFGQAGFLNHESTDQYPKLLKKEYEYQKHKYSLNAIPQKLWKFFRLRPSNFPTIRIAQFASLICAHTNLFRKVLEIETIKDFDQFFDNPINEYWDDRFLFDIPSTHIPKTIGEDFKHTLLINALIPFIFAYGKYKNEISQVEKAINLLQNIPSENNKIIRKWISFDMKSENAGDSQALIYLKKEYCDKNRCLECAIGHQVLKEDYVEYA